MSGKPAITPEELARTLDRLRALKHLTFTEACNEIGIPHGTIRYQLNAVIPGFQKKRPDLDWSIPVFAERTRGGRSKVGETQFGAETPDGVARLRDEISTLRTQIAHYDRQYADQKWIKERLYKLQESVVVQPEWITKPKKSIKSPGIPCAMWSDWHWAEVVDAAQVNGTNAYDLDIAHARVKALVERTIILLRQYMVSPHYDGIVLNLGGDMLSGNIHEELVSTNAVPIMAAVVDLWGVLEWAIKTLADEFGKVAIFCVTGNHGRDTKRIQHKDRAFTSFDWLIYMHLAHTFRSDKRVSIVAPSAPDVLYAVYSTKHLLTHGDQFRGGDGMIGHLGPVTRGQKKKLSRNAEIGQEFDVMVHGHFHQYSPGDRIIGNGSLVGYNEYAQSENFAFELPRQALWIVNPDHGITFHMPVYVDHPKTADQESRWVSWLEAA